MGDYVYGLLGGHACDGVYHGGAVVGYVVEYILGYVLPEGPREVVEVKLVVVCAYALAASRSRSGPSVVEIQRILSATRLARRMAMEVLPALGGRR